MSAAIEGETEPNLVPDLEEQQGPRVFASENRDALYATSLVQESLNQLDTKVSEEIEGLSSDKQQEKVQMLRKVMLEYVEDFTPPMSPCLERRRNIPTVLPEDGETATSTTTSLHRMEPSEMPSTKVETVDSHADSMEPKSALRCSPVTYASVNAVDVAELQGSNVSCGKECNAALLTILHSKEQKSQDQTPLHGIICRNNDELLERRKAESPNLTGLAVASLQFDCHRSDLGPNLVDTITRARLHLTPEMVDERGYLILNVSEAWDRTELIELLRSARLPQSCSD